MQDAGQIDHVGIAVRNIDDAIATYQNLLGCDIGPPERLEDRGIAVAFVGEQTPRLELLGPIAADNELAKFLDKRGEGIHHVCMRVDDLAAAVARLEAKGARLAHGGIRAGAHGSRVAFVHPKDTHGVLLELMQVAAAT